MLQESEARYRTVIENMPGGVILFEKGRGVYVNPQMQAILGYSAEDILKIDPLSLILPEEQEYFREMMRQWSQSDNSTADQDLWMLRKDGVRRYIKARACRVNPTGQIENFYVILHDITELKEAENELKKKCIRPKRIYAKNWKKKSITRSSLHAPWCTN